ncbi:Uncharacterised protein [uncultured archaeon]|nr:Uncharacterised protein [uncultured archaeon]
MIEIPANPGQQAGAPQSSQQKPDAEKGAEPSVDGFTLSGAKLKGTQELSAALSASSFLKVAVEGDTVAILNVESRDIKRNPYLFSIIYFKPSSIEIAYSIIPGTSYRKRKIEVARHLLNVLTLAEGAYQADERQVFQYLQSVMKEITEFASSEYSDIFAKFDETQRGFTELRKKAELLEQQNAKIGKELIESRSANDELTLRVKELEGFSDDTLMVKIQDWLDVHRNEINVPEFSKQYGVVESRVEYILNRMVLAGYLELR